jgi:tetratricopeptide (TPR) repeat protein
MNTENISKLLQRYFDASQKGKEPYFDVAEIEDILKSFEEKDDFTYYKDIVTLGLRLHPGSNDLKIRKCKLHLYKKEYEEAQALAGTINETNNVDLDKVRLECFCALDQYPKAAAYIQELIDRDCEYLKEIFEFTVPILNKLKKTDGAQQLIDKGLSLFPNNPVLKSELCFVLAIKGDYAEAIRICNELIDEKPNLHTLWTMLGRMYTLDNDFDNALYAFDKALACGGSDVYLKSLKICCLYMDENYEKAIEVYSEIPPDEPPADYVKVIMAECCMHQKNYEWAYVLFKEVLEGETDKEKTADCYINFVYCCARIGRPWEAYPMLIKAAEQHPGNIRILSLLALAHLEKGKDKLAFNIADQIIRLQGESAEDVDLAKKAKDLLAKRKFEKAVQYYNFLLHKQKKKNSPEDPPKENLRNKKNICPEDLTKEYLRNKKHNN